MAIQATIQTPVRRQVRAMGSVPAPFHAVTAVLADSPAEAFTATPAADPPVLVDFGGPMHLRRGIRLGWGHWFFDHDHTFTLPVWWEADEHPGFFPTFDGGLEVRPAGPAKTEIHLAGSYLPPLGLAGRFADQAVGHRVVRDSVERFLAEIAARLALAAHGEATR